MELSEHIASHRPLAETICKRLGEEINKLGFAADQIKHHPNFDQASFALIKDPYTGQQNLACYWYAEAKSQL